MDDNADALRILLASPPADWRRQLSSSSSSFNLLKNRINEKQLKTQKVSWTARLKALTAAH